MAEAEFNSTRFDPSRLQKAGSASRRAATATIAVCLVILFLGVANSYDHLTKVKEYRQAVIRTIMVLRQLASLENSLHSAESGQRGFLLTGKRRYLEPYHQAMGELDSNRGGLPALIQDDGQKAYLKTLFDLMERKTAAMKETVRLERLAGRAKAVDLVETDRGALLSEQIRATLDKMSAREEQLLKERTERLDLAWQQVFDRLSWILLLFFSFMLFTIFFAARANSTRSLAVRIQAALFDVARIANEPADNSSQLQSILSSVSTNLDWMGGACWQPDIEREHLVCTHFFVNPKYSLERFESDRRGLALSMTSLPLRVMESGNSCYFEDIVAEKGSPGRNVATMDGIKTTISFPVVSAGECLSVVQFFSDRQPPSDDLMLGALESLGSQIAQITKRLRTESRLKESERKFKAIFNQTFQLVGLLTVEGNLIEVNQTALDQANVRRDEVINRPFWECPWWSHSQDLQTRLRDAVLRAATGDFIRFEAEHPLPDGKMMAVDFSLKPIFDDDGSVILLLPEGRDISEKKLAERRVSEFYSTVSHELRTPLTSIRGALGLMDGGKAGDLSEKARRLVSMGKQECDRLVRLINDILDIRKIEAGKLNLKIGEVKSEEAIRETVQAIQPYAANHKVSIRLDLKDSDMVMADNDRLTQILTNLISNAIKFSSADAEVVIETRRLGGMMRFSVIDKGPGIKEPDQAKLFGLFQQIDSSDSRPKDGTGLGLAICKGLTEQQGGSIGVSSKLGEGSTFWFELPLASPAKAAPAVASYRVPVLLVEDDDACAHIIASTLAHDGIKVVRAATLEQAKKYLTDGKPLSAVILDIGLPDGSGIELIDQLTAGQKQIPVVVVTGRSDSKFSYPLLIDWIIKPFEEMRLIKSVKQAIGYRREGPPRVLIVEDDRATLLLIKEQLEELGIECLEAIDGSRAVEIGTSADLDLIILDLGLPSLDGFEVVARLKSARARATPLIVYTSRDVTEEDDLRLELGLTRYLTKSTTSEEEFLKSVRELLGDLIKSQPFREGAELK